MNCLVTGGSGFIGSHLCDLLVAEGHNVVVLDDLSTGNPINLNEAAKTEQLIFIQGGINEVERYANEIGHIDWIFHIAGRADLIPSIENPVDYFDVNTRGTLCMLEYAKRIGVKRFVYTASSTCYGIPDKYPTPETAACNVEHPYGLTKYLGEQLVIHWANVYQLPALSLRLFNVYGPRSRTSGVYGAVFGVFLKQKLEGKPYTVVGDGEQTRDFTYVGDVAKAFLAAAQSDKVGEIYNIGSGHTYSINKLVDLLGGEKTYIPRRPGEPNCTFADITKIQKEIGWKPAVTLEEGVQKMLDNIDFWRDAPLWTPESIQQATKTWFDCLNKYDTCK
ncbi:MAG: NAD-dependent dehydratase [Verrucomicrobia bacterium CG_4_10_14_3_um_filter_43_23]|nr:MAG: NAD-dependent dehydratase [Verrucomicrobia bacterium CG1_02_43_26]PIP58984.1 MAG: NAD-dependent dehydratase [Verrucomicrobia bacterium CG22_combo_CG10-13_8_21_14_all_43_17]PIX59082.1 MAG: NAD-dependent dehydratase [Verrucomicrobia bacterium CG_4_10_14_3_um_filter_43_23]PIY61396.1 MAG: NAD-dependent dehydratase [Verrucomicrobia bacterium CG_4_10_14_0_8_um_filter_43_34]PJA44178.1 MAG: NAD-dependent dehydratase [Verrucomicrobia bacterium CG_4_9_14_3_um_filter_43_20]